MFTKSNLDGFMCIDCGIDDCIRYLYEEVFKEEINLLYLPQFPHGLYRVVE